jgi:hypothetical protein
VSGVIAALAAACLALGVIAGPPFTQTYEDAFLDFIERGEMMTSRAPVLVDGDPSYDGSNLPVYDGGSDLGVGANTANTYGAHRREVAEFIMAEQGVRVKVYSNSQWSGGDNRQYLGMTRTWPVQSWAAAAATPSAKDPVFFNRNTGAVDEYGIDGGYNSAANTMTGGTTFGAFFTAEGIGDPGQLGMPWALLTMDDPISSGTTLGSLQLADGDAQGDNWRGGLVWGDSADPKNLGFRLFFVAGGSTSVPDAIQILNQGVNAAGSNDNFTDQIADQTALPNVHTLSAANGSAVIGYFDTTINETGTPAQSFRPRALFQENGVGFDGINFIALGGMLSQFDDGGDFLDTFSVVGVAYGSGQTPATWLHGTGWSDGSSTRYRMGSDFDTRVFLMEAMRVPNVLMIDLGHNSHTRPGALSAYKAQSVWQADLFDLIYQEGTTLRDGAGLLGELPYIVIRIPWYAGNLDQARHDEIIGVCDALEEHGFKVLVEDSFNRFGGEGFTPSASSPANFETATTFTLDNDNDPAGDGVHPVDQDSAEIAAYSIWKGIVEASEYVASTPRSRAGVRARASVLRSHGKGVP